MTPAELKEIEAEKERRADLKAKQLENVASFKKARATLISISSLILLMGMNASVAALWLGKVGLTVEQLLSLRGLIFFMLLVCWLRYYQATISSSQWGKYEKSYFPYYQYYLFKGQVFYEGQQDSKEVSKPEPPHFLYKFSVINGVKTVSRVGNLPFVCDVEKKKAWKKVRTARLKSLIRFFVSESNVMEFLWPSVFAFVALLEVTGLARISTFLLWLGDMFSRMDNLRFSGLVTWI